jgi:hypothetical protein
MPKEAAVKIILALALLLLFSWPVAAVDNQLGGRGFGFSCDVIDATCTCKGAKNGADCKAMKKMCEGGHIPLCSFDPETNKPKGCECDMALRVRQGIKDAPNAVAPMENKIQQ